MMNALLGLFRAGHRKTFDPAIFDKKNARVVFQGILGDNLYAVELKNPNRAADMVAHLLADCPHFNDDYGVYQLQLFDISQDRPVLKQQHFINFNYTMIEDSFIEWGKSNL